MRREVTPHPSSDGWRRHRRRTPSPQARGLGGRPQRRGRGVRGRILAALLISLAAFSSGCRRRPAPPKAYAAFIVNHQSSTLAEVDLAKFSVLATVAVAARPERVLVRPQRKELWVVSASGEISVVEFPGLRVVRNLHIGEGARDLAFSAHGRRAFILEPATGQIVFLDSENYRETTRLNLGTPLTDLALTPDGNTLVASSRAANRLFFVEADDQKVLGSVKVGKAPGAMVILPNSSKVFVCDTEEGAISAADLTTQQLLSNIEIGIRPGPMVLKPDGESFSSSNRKGPA